MQVCGSWLTAPRTQAVCAMLTGAGYRALFVGGCVRNALLGVAVNDLDIATDARPETVMQLATRAGFAAIPTGIDHGTITVVAEHVPHEITTFRKDVATDGRRAVVAFSDHVEDDAGRRDFTMNALYAEPDGTLVDPLGGLGDLRARRVRFIDDAGARIREDYLRILRFFRFHAWYGDPRAGMDAEALAAIAENLSGLAALSRERVGAETIKLLAAADPAPSVAAMRACGALTALLPGADDRALAPLVHLETAAGIGVDPIRRLAALGGEDAARRLRLSRKQARLLALLHEQIAGLAGPAELGYRLGSETAWSVALLRAALQAVALDPGLAGDIARGAVAAFPVRSTDLSPKLSGAALGRELKRLEKRWIKSGFTLGRAELLTPEN
ncbi:CCA tRNA nucleotidyltransferase [Shimia sp.]|uniref:CCA tRNA nucleotidyltransferase n=1 Tax=Shimia sp. TaxID=1954381 RepID=UPI003565950A